MKTCETCKAFSGLEQVCKIDGPKPLFLGWTNEKQPMIVGAFASTNKDQWCLRHIEQEVVIK